MENQLNEENLQLAFNFNPSNGNLTKNRIIGEILIEEANKRIAIQESSDKIAIDLGYSIDGDIEDMEFTINLEKLLVKTVCQRWELVECIIKENEVVIVCDEPSFKTCLWLNKSSIGKTLNYKIISQNTSLSSWMLDIIARKLNKFNVQDLVSLEENIENINTSITTLNDQVTELQNNSGSGGEVIPEIDINGYSILRQKKLTWRPRTTDYGGLDSWSCIYRNVDVTRYSDGRGKLIATCQIYNSNSSSLIEPHDYIDAYIGSPVKLTKIHSFELLDIKGFRRIGALQKLVAELVDAPNPDANDPHYGAINLDIRNILNRPLHPHNGGNGCIYEISILFDFPESSITDYDYILD